jgi:hypothetical protein
MRYQFSAFSERIRRSRAASSFAVVIIAVSAIATTSVAQARVDPGSQGGVATAQSPDTVAKATGGGTVLAFGAPDTTVASFGFNARRTVGFPGGGLAEGRLNYDRHQRGVAGVDRHVNVSVAYMQATTTQPPSPNGTGGSATIAAACPVGSCPTNIAQVIAYVEDNSDSGANSDVFRIFFCAVAQPTPFPDFSSGVPEGCTAEGGSLRTGNIQVRGEAGITGETMGTASGSGAYNMTPNVNGVELSGGTFGIGLRTAGPGDLEANLNGVQPLIGLFQHLTVTGWITSTSVNGSTMSFSGTASLDMGDGTAALNGLPLSGSMTASGVTLTVGSWSFGTLPKADGFITIE